MRKVPTFTADGRRLRDYSLTAIERLLAQERVAVERDWAGAILRVYFRPTDERQNPIPARNPIRKSVHRGTYYSSLRQEGNVRLWRLDKLPTSRQTEHLFGPAQNAQESELFVRAIFTSVERSVMQRKPAPVIAIDACKKSSEKLREIDPVSELANTALAQDRSDRILAIESKQSNEQKCPS